MATITTDIQGADQARKAAWISPETHLRLRQASLVKRRQTQDIADEAIREWLDRNAGNGQPEAS